MSGVIINKVGEQGDTFTKNGLYENPVTPRASFPSGPGLAGDTFKSGGGRRRRKHTVKSYVATKTFPKGILRRTSRILPSSNPSIPSGGKTRKHRLRLTTPKGLEKTRRQMHARISKVDIHTIRAKLQEKGVISKDSKKKIPEKILRTLYEDSVGAGLLS